jgi:hypothetical protein
MGQTRNMYLFVSQSCFVREGTHPGKQSQTGLDRFLHNGQSLLQVPELAHCEPRRNLSLSEKHDLQYMILSPLYLISCNLIPVSRVKLFL